MQNDISRIWVCRATLKVSRLFFDGDTLIFFKVTMRECEGILGNLHKYGEASGQCINFEKSSILLRVQMLANSYKIIF